MHTSKSLLKIISKPVDVKRLIDKLGFDLDGLEEAAMDQPRLRLKAGRLKVQMILHKAQLKRHLSAVIGKKSIHIRRKHGNSYTATAIRNELGYDKDVRRAQKQFDIADALETFATDLTESYKERSMALLNLVKLRNSEVASELRAVKGRAEVEGLLSKAKKLRDSYEEIEDDNN